MSYQTPTEFKARAFPSGSFNDVDNTVIQSYLDSAAAEINAALRPHHELSADGNLKNPDGLILECETVMVSHRLLFFTGRQPNSDQTSESAVFTRYAEIVGENGVLERLARGTVLLARTADETTTREGRSRIVGSGKPTSARKYLSSGDEYV